MVPSNYRPLVSAGTLLGMGMGGFIDGIVFHQLLQIHSMMSARFPLRGVDTRTLAVNLEINMFWDGLFFAVTWLFALLGIMLLWRAVRQPDVPLSTRAFLGSLILGWGLFNVVEGVIDHHLLHVHHVTETDNHLVWDVLFLASGITLILIGRLLIRSADGDSMNPSTEPNSSTET